MPLPENGESWTRECDNCGEPNCKYTVADYIIEYDCPYCDDQGHDHFEYLYGCMSAPWGYLC
jgi:hypothetical protein